MLRAIVVSVPHNLGAKIAKERISQAMERLRREYLDKLAHSEVVWTGNKADIRVVALAQTIAATIDVQDDSLRIEVQLPWILNALSDKIQSVLAKRAKDSLQIEHLPLRS